MRLKRLTVGTLQTNCYILYEESSGKCLIVDPGDDAEYISGFIEKEKLIPENIIATHGHFDHILGAFALQSAYDIPFLIHKKDEFLISRMRTSAKHFTGIGSDPPPKVNGNLSENLKLQINNSELIILFTPGHTPGSISLYSRGVNFLISGDVIFDNGGVGRTDFKYSDKSLLKESISKIFELPEDTTILPGHGNETSVKKAKSFQ